VHYTEADAAACLSCHAPLADQQEPLLQVDLEALAADPKGYRPKLLARHGVYCAACHLRDGVMNAPGITPSPAGTRIHDEVRIEPLMRDSRFCAACHQSDPATAVNGKPLQDTYREWLDSPYPAQDMTCQACHMPERAHRFRGIHDSDTVRRGLTISTRSNGKAAILDVRSTGVGHRFPTYIVPRIEMSGTLLDVDARPIAGGERVKVLQRSMSIENGRWIEQSDTRLEPGATATLRVPWHAGGHCGKAVRFQILVEPEWFYHEKVYPTVLAELEEGPVRDLIEQARLLAKDQSFVLFETLLPHDRQCPEPGME
jgi:mono/diheme cytochrome c family protein